MINLGINLGIEPGMEVDSDEARVGASWAVSTLLASTFYYLSCSALASVPAPTTVEWAWIAAHVMSFG